MSTNTELIARLKEQCDRDAAEHCPAEIIALQAEGIAAIEALEATRESLETENVQLTELLRVRDAQLAAAQGQSLPILQVSAFVEGFLDEVEEPPEHNCRCYISPPCNDCVDHSCLRELFLDARRLVKTIAELGAAPIPQQPAQSAPEGWKLVPIEPTKEILEAMAEMDGYFDPTDRDYPDLQPYRDVWEKAVAAQQTQLEPSDDYLGKAYRLAKELSDHLAPAPAPQGELAEIARLHDRIKDLEADVEYLQYTKPAPQAQEPLTDEAIHSIVLSEFKCFPLPFDIRLTRAIEAAIKQGGQQ